jgi:hypothetical protein
MAWTTPPDFVAGTMVPETDLNALSDDLSCLLTRNQLGISRSNGSDYTTSSTSFVDIDSTNLTFTLTPVSTILLVLFSGTFHLGATGSLYLDLTVDTVLQGGSNGIQYITTNSALDQVMTIFTVVTVAAGAAHTIRPQWKVSTNTGTLYANTARPQFTVVQIG